MKLEMRADGSRVSKVHGVRRMKNAGSPERGAD